MFGRSALTWHPRNVIVGLLLILAVGIALAVPGRPSSAQAASDPAPQAAISAPGTIAYLSGDLHQIRLIQPDGSGDHAIWNAPVVGFGQSQLYSVAWRPDSAELAFVSDMEQTASIYQYDIYGIAPDGSGLRRISNPPDASQLGRFPKASVDVTVRNHDLSDSVFFVYVGGAAQALNAVIPAGTSKTVHFDNVAVFQGQAQFAVAIDGNTRWIGLPNGTFQPGTTNQASVDVYASNGQDYFGTYYPVWRTDGTEVDDPLGYTSVGEKWPASAPPGTTTSSLIQASASMPAMARGWTSAQADQILYYDPVAFVYEDSDGAIRQATEGSAGAGTPVFDPGSGAVSALEYLPDGSGFLFSYRPSMIDTSIDLYRCTIPCTQPVKLTQLTNKYIGGFSISSDGQYVVFEVTTGDPLDPNVSHPYDLWMMKIDGTIVAQPFVSNARIPSWSRGAPRILSNKVYLPAIFR